MSNSARNWMIGGGLAAGALAIISSRRPQGSWAKMSPLQRALLTASRQYKVQPEVFIRIADFVIGAVPGESRISNLPGIKDPAASLIADIQYLENTNELPWLPEGQTASLSDYARLIRQRIQNDQYYTRTNLYNTPDFYGLLASWVGPQIGRLLKAARTGKLRVSAAARKDYTDGQQLLTGIPDQDNAFPASPEEAQVLKTLSSWHDGISEVGDWLDALRAMDPLANRMPYNLKTEVTLKPGVPNFYGDKAKQIRPLTIEEVKKASSLWHREIERQTQMGKVIPGKLIYELPQGWRVEKLTSRAHLKAEGTVLAHCIGRSNTYWNTINSGTHTVHSLRDSEGMPQLTLYLTLDERGKPTRLDQAKGKSNRSPGGRGSSTEECSELRAYMDWISGDRTHHIPMGGDLAACQTKWAAEDREKAEAQRQAGGQRPRPRRRGRRQEEEG
jgi:hypothetical protein